MAPIFLTAEWRNLLMVNFIVDPVVLHPWIPRGTELDFDGGRTFVSVVGFRFLRTRVLGLPVPGHVNFDEVNLRFYVRRKRGTEWVKGVVFIKELVPRRAIAWVARTLYNENYVHVPMRSSATLPGRVSYAWSQKERWSSVSADVVGPARQPAPSSIEAFISEHYWGYSRQRDGGTVEYQVEHPAWQVWSCENAQLDADVPALYGDSFVETLRQPPASAFLASGSHVTVRRGVRI